MGDISYNECELRRVVADQAEGSIALFKIVALYDAGLHNVSQQLLFARVGEAIEPRGWVCVKDVAGDMSTSGSGVYSHVCAYFRFFAVRRARVERLSRFLSEPE